MKFKKATAVIVSILFLSLNVTAAIPDGYYDSATGSGYTLKTQLYNIIDGHTSVSYTPGVWNAFSSTDVDNYYENNGCPLDMYSENPAGADPYNWTFVADQCGTYGVEGDCYNREHSFPKNWFNDAAPMYTDLFHLYLTDGKVNGMRNNYPFGEVNAPTWTSENGSKLGPCSYPGYSGTVFEPLDEFKGDFARTYFYMATRYENIIAGWQNNDTNGNAILNGTSDQVYEQWYLNMITEWHNNDPVSQKEIDRNNVIYADIQHNRNPFIDHPEYVNIIWGGAAPVPTINFVTASQSVEENIGTRTVTLSISQAIPDAVTANLTLTGTASTGNDYTISQSSVIFPASSTGNQSVTLTIVNDADPEDFETIIITINNLVTDNTEIIIGGNNQITFTINNSDGFDDTPPVILANQLLNDSTLVLSFSEKLDTATAETETNYSLNNGIGNPLSAQLGYSGDSSKVVLLFPVLTAGTSYQLTVNNVEDLAGNSVAVNTLVNFAVPSGSGGDGWVEPFEEDTNWGGSYYIGTVTFPSGDWEFNKVFIEGPVDTPYEGVQSVRISQTFAGANLTTPYVNGVDSVSFYYRSYRAASSSFVLQKSVNDGPFVNLQTQAYSQTAYDYFSYKVDDPSDNIRIRILNNNQPERLCIDYFKVVTFPQSLSSPSDVSTQISGSNLILSWSPVAGATKYDVYSSNDPYTGFVLENTVYTEEYSVEFTDTKKFYYIIASTSGTKTAKGENERFIDIKKSREMTNSK